MTSVTLDRYTAFMLRHQWLVLASAVAVMLVLTAGFQFITISNDWRDMLDEDNPQLVAFDTLEDTYTATNAAMIAVAPKGGSVFTREALGAIEELTEAAWRVPWSTRVDSLTNYTHTESVEDDLTVERLVDDAGSLSDDDLATEATGISLVFAHLNIQNTTSMLGGTVTAMALISLLLIGIFRSVRLGLVSLVPNFIPATMAFGVWGYLYGEVGNAGSLVTAIAFGAVVDDTIHFMSNEGASRGPFRVRGGALRLPFGRSGAVHHDHDAGTGLPGVRFVGIRDQLDARPPGCAHDRFRAALRFPAPPALADSPRPKDTMMPAHLARSVNGVFALCLAIPVLLGMSQSPRGMTPPPRKSGWSHLANYLK